MKLRSFLISGLVTFALAGCGGAGPQEVEKSASDDTTETGTIKGDTSEIETAAEDTVGTQVTETAEQTTGEKSTEENSWYTKDSKYAKSEPVRKTVDLQMEELGIDDPVKAIIVNNVQTYLYSSGSVSMDVELTAPEVAQRLEYSRDGMAIDIKLDGAEPTQLLIDTITKELRNISGKDYIVI